MSTLSAPEEVTVDPAAESKKPTARSFSARPSVRKTPSPPPRQTSEDSGIEPDCCCSILPDDDENDAATADSNAFILVASMTAAAESESFLLCQPNWAPFLAHVRRTIGPLRMDLEAILRRQRRGGRDGWPDQEILGEIGPLSSPEDLLASLATRAQRFCQEALIAFPKSLATAGRSPRYQDSLKMAVENLVLQLLHTNHMWPLITGLFRYMGAIAIPVSSA